MFLKIKRSPLTPTKKVKLNFDNVKYVLSTGGSYYIARARGRNVEYLASWNYEILLEHFDGYDDSSFKYGDKSYILNEKELITFLDEKCYITNGNLGVYFFNKTYYYNPNE